MSVIFVVTPLVVGAGWPVFGAAVAAAAAQMGLSALKGEQAAVRKSRASVTLEVDNVEAAAEGLREGDHLAFGDQNLRVTIARDARGRCTVHVDGQGSEQELRARGQALLDRAMQQFAYQKVAQELTKRGFQIVEEQVTGQQQIRIRFRKFE